MKYICLFNFYLFLLGVLAETKDNDTLDLTFPDKFFIGVATSAAQTEGAWNESGKSESIWDHYTHNHPERISDRSNIDVATDFYHKYKDDIQLVKDAGFTHFRFSISWSRLLPSGYANSSNADGIRFYHDVLDELARQGLAPFVTLYHWDHPQALEDQLGGWLSEAMAYAFADYARFVFREYGSKIKYYVTINEPQIMCNFGYTSFVDKMNDTSDYYTCVHNQIKAHALAYRAYERDFRSQQRGQLGIVQSCFYFYAVNASDKRAREVALEFACGETAEAIFSANGGYSEALKGMVAERSKAQGLGKSKLPEFSEEWIARIKGSYDFFGLNHYTSYLVESYPPSEMASWPNDQGLRYTSDPSWPASQSDWLKVVPEGFREILKYIKNKFNNPLVLVTEFGVPDSNGTNDNMRINYLYSYTKELLKAVKEDNCNVGGMIIWSLMDSFEWRRGYVDKFGIYHVDFKDANLKRTPKKSVKWLKSVISSRKLQSPPPLDE